MDYHFSYNSLECMLNEETFNREMLWEEVSEDRYRIFSAGSTGTVYEMRFQHKNTLWMIPPQDPYESNGVSYEFMAYVHKRT